MSIDKAEGRLRLAKLMPGVSLEQVRQNIGFDILVTSPPSSIAPPSSRELRLLREEVDPNGVYLKARV
jgi:glutaconate CoA-transferase subunit B